MIRIMSYFNNFESFAQTIQGWGLDFKQLDCGSFEAKLHQFGNQDFLVTNAAITRNVLQSLTYPEVYVHLRADYFKNTPNNQT